MKQNISIRCLTIYSGYALPDPSQWISIFQACRPLFERGDEFFKEFYYLANHGQYNALQLSKIFEVFGPCLANLEYLGFHFGEYYPEKFFNELNWRELPNLRHLQLKSMKIPASGINVLVKGFEFFPNLELLSLYRSDMDLVQNDQETPGSHTLAQQLPKLKMLNWISIVGNGLSRSGIEKVVLAVATMNNIKKLFLNENKTDGETIEFCLDTLRNLSQLRHIDFTNPCHIFETLAEKKALKWHILRPFQLPFAFPSIQQLRFVGYGYQLNDKMEEDPDHENIEQAIREGIKRIRPHCSVEF